MGRVWRGNRLLDSRVELDEVIMFGWAGRIRVMKNNDGNFKYCSGITVIGGRLI